MHKCFGVEVIKNAKSNKQHVKFIKATFTFFTKKETSSLSSLYETSISKDKDKFHLCNLVSV